jgi:tetratricopeptide (TPR) repeat protein
MDNQKRQINPASLENLKLGAQARYQDKQKLNLTVLPGTKDWLKKSGNASQRVDDLVNAAQTGRLTPDNGQPNEMLMELNDLRENCRDFQKACIALDRDLDRCVLQKMGLQERLKKQDAAIAVLTEALTLKANAGGAIKAEIKKALELLQ